MHCSIILKDEHSQKVNERWVDRDLLDSATDSDITDSDPGEILFCLNFLFFKKSQMQLSFSDEDLDAYGDEQPNAFNIGRYEAMEFLNTNRNLPMFRRLHIRQFGAGAAAPPPSAAAPAPAQAE